MKSGDVLIWHCNNHIRLEKLQDAIQEKEKAWRMYQFMTQRYIETVRECSSTS